jgi:hypothetical protein
VYRLSINHFESGSLTSSTVWGGLGGGSSDFD